MLPNYDKDTLTRFFIRTFEAFLARQQPVSNMANPACMNMTSAPQRQSHAESMAPAILSWVSAICFSSFRCSSNNSRWACSSRRSSAGESCDIAVAVTAAASAAARQSFMLSKSDDHDAPLPACCKRKWLQPQGRVVELCLGCCRAACVKECRRNVVNLDSVEMSGNPSCPMVSACSASCAKAVCKSKLLSWAADRPLPW